MVTGRIISTRFFRYDKQEVKFFTEVSNLPDQSAPFQRLFDDSADVGFFLESEKTRLRVKLLLVNIIKDKEGDLICWEFSPASGTIKVVIWND